jgi:FlaG/FlaF family flagellin (archaellin)
MTFNNPIKVLTIALVVGLAAGCATVSKEDLDRVEAKANQAQATADSALAAANDANAKAEAAERCCNQGFRQRQYK